MNIQIRSQQEAGELVAKEPGKHHVVYITQPNDSLSGFYFQNVVKFSAKYLLLQFDDVVRVAERLVPPSVSMIDEAVEFSKGKDSLIVCCQAGISRSSATAVVIACANGRSVEEALGMLDEKVHWPNIRVISCGERVLGVTGLVDKVNEWKDSLKYGDDTLAENLSDVNDLKGLNRKKEQ